MGEVHGHLTKTRRQRNPHVYEDTREEFILRIVRSILMVCALCVESVFAAAAYTYDKTVCIERLIRAGVFCTLQVVLCQSLTFSFDALVKWGEPVGVLFLLGKKNSDRNRNAST